MEDAILATLSDVISNELLALDSEAMPTLSTALGASQAHHGGKPSSEDGIYDGQHSAIFVNLGWSHGSRSQSWRLLPCRGLPYC